MSTTVLIEVDARHEAILRRALALVQEMEQLALNAPDGAVLGACEEAVIRQGRDLQRQVLSDAVALRIEAAEKRGPLCAPAPAAARGRTEAPGGAP